MKKQKSIPVWTLLPNQYEWKIYLCLSKKPYKQLIQIFNKNYNFNITQEEMTTFNACENSDCTLFNAEQKKAFIVLRNYNRDARDFSTIGHEVFHVASMIAQTTNIPMDFDNTTEVWAYFISFYMDMIIQTLDKQINYSGKC